MVRKRCSSNRNSVLRKQEWSVTLKAHEIRAITDNTRNCTTSAAIAVMFGSDGNGGGIRQSIMNGMAWQGVSEHDKGLERKNFMIFTYDTQHIDPVHMQNAWKCLTTH